MNQTRHIRPIFSDGTKGDWIDTNSEDPCNYDNIIRGVGLAFVQDGGTVKQVVVGRSECKGCEELPGFAPNHFTSHGRCESGNRPHCTCPICWG